MREHAARSAFVDLDTAEQIAAVLHTLLATADALTAEHRAWLQAACLYFAQTSDGEPDLDSIVGFDDDAEVLNHVLERIDRADLLLEL